MFTMPLHRDILVTSYSDASTLNLKKKMTEIMHQNVRDTNDFGGSSNSLPERPMKRSGENTPISNRSYVSSHESSPTKYLYDKKLTKDIFKKSLSTTSLIPVNDISPNHTQFFEVMYVGKIKVSHKRVPFTFIDDALPKFKAYDALRLQKLQETTQKQLSIEQSHQSSMENLLRKSKEDEELIKSENGKSNDLRIVEASDLENNDKIINTKLNTESKVTKEKFKKPLLRGQSQSAISFSKTNGENDNEKEQQSEPPSSNKGDLPPIQRDRASSIGSIPIHDPNRTMVFLVGKADIRLISPDKKQILLHKDFKEISTCVQGHTNPDHFGIICREDKTEGYIGYVFKGQSEDVVNDIVSAISLSFNNLCLEKKEKRNSYTCEHCPMVWYNRLCCEIEGLSDKKIQTTIFKRIDQLAEEEQDIIMAKYYGAEEIADHNMSDKNQFLMLMLKAHCESRQQRHVHDTAENRSEFLNQYLGGSTIFMKARKSITSSFDHLLKRKGSKDDFGHLGLVNEPLDQNKKNNIGDNSKGGQSGSRRNSDESKENQIKSHMMDMFIKVGNNPKSDSDHIGSWRQEILNRVVSSNKEYEENTNAKLIAPLRKISTAKKPQYKRTKEDLRELWRSTIRQIIILSRMEKENLRLQEQHNEHEIKKIKLDYNEIQICGKQTNDMWDLIINHDLQQSTKRDEKVLLQAIKNGVPKIKRGEVWMFLAEQHCLNTPPVDTNEFPNFNTPYAELLKRLTEHQRAIFIDLGRTFPNHEYYKQALGVGQLSLFNLLKAYSILDPELGYCQGLGFICGVLLLHLEEVDAFEMLKYLMFRRQMRNKYLPDMKQFQLQLYQMSRLLKDYLPEIYLCFDQYDISPTLYAAPWILTVYSSQFPLGFVTRVFDYLFLESSEVIFKIAISILDNHKEEILRFNSFEEIMDYLKEDVPNMNGEHMDKIMREAFSMDISKQLSEYQVEYNVLQEEITTQNYHLDELNKIKIENTNLKSQLELAEAKLKEYDKIRHSNQNQLQAAQAQVNGLEVTIDVLGQFISDLMDIRHDIEYPGEVRRIIQQFNQVAQNKTPKLLDRKIGKSKSINAHTGFPLRVLEELNENLDKDIPTKNANQITKQSSNKSVKHQNTLKSNSTAKLIPKEELKVLRKSSSVNEEDLNFTKTNFNNEIQNSKLTDVKPMNQKPELEAIISENSTKPDIDYEVNSDKLNERKEIPSNEKTNPPSPYENVTVSANEEEYKDNMHPLSNCEDINFNFKGTTQLKSIRPIHSRTSSTSSLRSLADEFDKNGRS